MCSLEKELRIMIFDSVKLYYFVRSDFFHHNHIHNRKVEILRNSGINAEMVAIVSRQEFIKYKSEYINAKQNYGVNVLKGFIGGSGHRYFSLFVKTYFLLQSLLHKKIIIQCLLVNCKPIIQLRDLSYIRSKLSLITEYEGDLPAECAYWGSVGLPGGPLESPLPQSVDKYNELLSDQLLELSSSDGIICVSNEHLKLIKSRTALNVKALIYPTFPNVKFASFNAESRSKIRKNIGYEKNIIFTHLGGVVNPWHRFSDICKLIKQLHSKCSSIRLLGLIRQSELDSAEKMVSKHEIGDIVKLIYVPPNQVGDYLSAADVGIFVRHNHTMTRIVSSAKLGEYLSNGLPVLSTGAHSVYNEFIEKNNLSIKISEELSINDKILLEIQSASQLETSVSLREDAGNIFNREFNIPEYENDYKMFCKQFLN